CPGQLPGRLSFLERKLCASQWIDHNPVRTTMTGSFNNNKVHILDPMVADGCQNRWWLRYKRLKTHFVQPSKTLYFLTNFVTSTPKIGRASCKECVCIPCVSQRC